MTRLNLANYLPLEEGHYDNCKVKKIITHEDTYEKDHIDFVDITFIIEGREIMDRIFTNSDRFGKLAVSLAEVYGNDFDTSLIVNAMVNLTYSRNMVKGTEYNQTDNWEWLGGGEHVPF